jgi:phosphatidylserine decarboxylase
MSLRDKYLFFQQVASEFKDVGAIFPTGGSAARALCSEIRRRRGPQRIMEVGCGTGPVTEEILASMSSEDRLTICDLNESFLNYVKNRFANEPKFKKRAHQVDFYLGDITEYKAENEFDVIISSIPFTTLTGPLLQKVLDHYRYLLKPGGSLTYIEYAYFRDIRDTLQPINKDEHFEEVSDIIRQMLDAHEYRAELIRSNFPPAFVRSLRFEEAPAEQANSMRPDPEQRRVKIGPMAFASDGIPVVASLLGAGVLWKLSKKRGWPIPFMMAGFATWFHRDPKRLVVADRSLCLAAADGQVIGVREIRHPRLGDETWTRVETFLAPTNVHINRSPVAGRVIDRWEEPGGYSPAFLGDAENNDSSYIVLETEHGRCAIAQRSGVLARKIFTWCQKGELLTQGERYGLIRLGSRTDIYLPKGSAEVLVQVGDRVIAGRTPVARYHDKRRSD